MEPTPVCPMVSCPGLTFAISIIAGRLDGPFKLATKTTGDLPATMTGTKSRAGS